MMSYDVGFRNHSIQLYHESAGGITTRLRITFGYHPATPADLLCSAMPAEAYCDGVHVLRGDYWVYADEWFQWGFDWVADNLAEIQDSVERDLEFSVFLEAGVTPGLASVSMQGNA